MRSSRIISLTGILFLVLAVAGCGSTSGSSDDSAVVGNRAESFTKAFLEAKVSDVSSYFADNVELITMNGDGTTSSEPATRADLQAMYTNDYKAIIDAARVGVPTLSLSAVLTTKSISMSGSTATVVGDVKVTATVESNSQSLDIPGCSLTFTKAGSTWVITKWGRPDVDMFAFLSGLSS